MEEALRSFGAAAESDPTYGDAWRGKGLLDLKLGRFVEAADALGHATEARLEDKSLWYIRAVAEERAGQLDPAVESYDRALRLDARDPATWASKGLALLRLKRFDDALKSFDAALALDPASEAAGTGKRHAEERIHIATIEGFAEAVVRFEKHLDRPATRDEVFRYCSVPLEHLDEVVKYVNEPAPLAPDRIEADELRKYEAVGAAVLQHVDNAQTLESLRLTDVSAVLPNVDLEEARTIWGYIDWIRDAPLEPTPEWHNDDLIRQAMDLPKEEWNLVDLARELHLGPFEAKKLEVSLRIFEGGGYKITTKATPEPKSRKSRAETHVVPTKKGGAEDEEADEDEVESEDRKPAAPKTAASTSTEPAPTKCATHHAPGLERHACGASLCRACLDAGGVCAECHAPLTNVAEREARKKDRQEDFGRL